MHNAITTQNIWRATNSVKSKEKRERPEEIMKHKGDLHLLQLLVNQVQEAQRASGRINPRRNTLRHTVIKLTKIKDKDKWLKSTRRKWQITYKERPTRLSADFSIETLQARREWHDIFKVMKGKNLQPRILYPARLSFRFDREIKSFPDKQKLKRIQHTKPALQQMLKELL